MSETPEKIRIQAMEQLAAGVARALSESLTVLNGHAHLLLNRKSSAIDTDQSLRELCVASHHAAQIARDLRSVARTHVLQTTELELGRLIESLAPVMRQTLGEIITLRLNLDPQAPAIKADPDLVEHLLMNLASVAADSMPAGGTFTLVTERAPCHDAETGQDQATRAAVCLRAEFSHWFVPPEALPRVFEPFSDVVLDGNRGGPGLRLAATRGIVTQHHGGIEAASNAATGTRLIIRFPIHQLARVPSKPGADLAPSRSAGADPAPAGPRPEGPAPALVTVLLVEDEDAVRKLGAIILKDLGYRVLQADSGPAAQEIWKWYGDRIQVLLTDLALPGDLSGLDLARIFQSERPGLNVVLTSGSLEDIARDELHRLVKPRLLQKPYGVERLAAILQEMLADGMAPRPDP